MNSSFCARCEGTIVRYLVLVRGEGKRTSLEPGRIIRYIAQPSKSVVNCLLQESSSHLLFKHP